MRRRVDRIARRLRVVLSRPCLVLCLLAVAAPAHAQSLEEVFVDANRAYEDGRYAEAAELYTSLLRYRVRDARLEFNLANTEFRLGRLGPAILHYERARRLDPVDADVLANLEFARSRRFDRVEPPQRPQLLSRLIELQNRLGPDRQAWLLLALIWSVVGIVTWCSARPGRWAPGHGWVLAVLLIAVALLGASWRVTSQRLDGRELAVVMAQASDVLAGPGENNPALFTVHEGLTVDVQTIREEWIQVSLPNGYNGWLPRSALEFV